METNPGINSGELARLDFCRDLTNDDCAILASLAVPMDLELQQVLFRCGEAADACFLVERGLIALEICAAGIGCRRIGTAGPGELIGWSPFLADSCFSASARAMQDSRVLRIPARKLRAACDHNPEFGYRILKRVVRVLAERINATRMQMLDMFGPEHPGIFDFPEPASPTGDVNENR
jgi:CRP-like cAMP-binding protein